MRSRFEDQPWYSEWKKTTDRVIAALMARDSTKQGTPEREAADREYEAAIVAFRLLAEQHDDRPIFGRKRVPSNKTKRRATKLFDLNASR